MKLDRRKRGQRMKKWHGEGKQAQLEAAGPLRDHPIGGRNEAKISGGQLTGRDARRCRRLLAGLCLLMTLLLSGCGQGPVFDGSRAANKSRFEMDYAVLNREETADMALQEGDELLVELSHTSGSVDVKVGQPGRDAIYSGAGQTNASFALTIPASGTYQISVTGHQAAGRVSFLRRAQGTEAGE